MKIERIKGTDGARFTFRLDSDDLQWRADATAKKREADIAVSGAALGSVFAKGTLSSEIATWKLSVPLETDKMPIHSEVSVTIHIPPKTQRLRFVVRDTANGRMGTVDLKPEAMTSALVTDAPTSALQPASLCTRVVGRSTTRIQFTYCSCWRMLRSYGCGADAHAFRSGLRQRSALSCQGSVVNGRPFTMRDGWSGRNVRLKSQFYVFLFCLSRFCVNMS